MIARRALNGGPTAAVKHQMAAATQRVCSSAPHVKISAVFSVAGFMFRAIIRAIFLSAFIGRTITDSLFNLLAN